MTAREAEVGRSQAYPAAQRDEPLARASGVVWCRKRRTQAVISVVERHTETSSLRYIQWCSLLGVDLDCDEHCIGCLGGGSVEPSEVASKQEGDGEENAAEPTADIERSESKEPT